MKICKDCKQEKPLTEFGKDCRQRDGIKRLCRVCVSVRNANWRSQNPTYAKEKSREWTENNHVRHMQVSKRWRDKNKDHIAQYRLENRDHINALRRKRYDKEKQRIWWVSYYERKRAHLQESTRRYYQLNQERCVIAAANFKRRRATPPWAQLDKITVLYQDARRLTRETGVLHVVDHIWPIKGKTSSGLHIFENLQIITGSENSSKNNKAPDEYKEWKEKRYEQTR
jgi:hypothetical protein